ncbi:hypothetical protein BUALT_Bualt19G0041700 [Buddleja alternifolia]|uniref:F-box/WD-40 repeat-containing protein n=1 Tax=Buddleja alternifolia TaxID=168488 RepID=A0AAV6W9A1_9LAMI|nr:hypothetical protein BUALT_Bualt19G0041700 [Buddleja alternifolia]
MSKVVGLVGTRICIWRRIGTRDIFSSRDGLFTKGLCMRYVDPQAVVGCEDGRVRVFDLYSRKVSQIINFVLFIVRELLLPDNSQLLLIDVSGYALKMMHHGPVSSISFTDEQLIVSGSSLGSISMSDLSSDQRVDTLGTASYTGGIKTLCLNPSSYLLFAGSSAGYASCWDLRGTNSDEGEYYHAAGADDGTVESHEHLDCSPCSCHRPPPLAALRVQSGGTEFSRSSPQPFRNSPSENRIIGPTPRLALPAPPEVTGSRPPDNNREGGGGPRPVKAPFRRLTDSERDELRCKGLCFRCKALFHLMHDCPMKHLRILLVEDDEAQLLKLEEIDLMAEWDSPPFRIVSVDHFSVPSDLLELRILVHEVQGCSYPKLKEQEKYFSGSVVESTLLRQKSSLKCLLYCNRNLVTEDRVWDVKFVIATRMWDDIPVMGDRHEATFMHPQLEKALYIPNHKVSIMEEKTLHMGGHKVSIIEEKELLYEGGHGEDPPLQRFDRANRSRILDLKSGLGKIQVWLGPAKKMLVVECYVILYKTMRSLWNTRVSPNVLYSMHHLRNDKSTLVVGGIDGVLRILDQDSGEVLSSCIMEENGNIYSRSRDRNVVIEKRRGVRLSEDDRIDLMPNRPPIACLAVGMQKVVTTHSDRYVRVWKFRTDFW